MKAPLATSVKAGVPTKLPFHCIAVSPSRNIPTKLKTCSISQLADRVTPEGYAISPVEPSLILTHTALLYVARIMYSVFSVDGSENRQEPYTTLIASSSRMGAPMVAVPATIPDSPVTVIDISVEDSLVMTRLPLGSGVMPVIPEM